MKTILALLAFSATISADMPFMNYSEDGPKIGVQNSILSKVNGKTISMIDVKKKMDVVFHQSYPQYASSPQARLQFYETSWRHVLMEMIDNELILSDANDKEIKVSDGEIRESMEERFGPSVTQTLDKIGLTFDEAWKMVKNDLIIQRMSWWFIHSKAVSAVTPQDIKQAYRIYLEKNPAYSEWTYRVVSIRTDRPDDALSQIIYKHLAESNSPPETLLETLKAQYETPGVSISLSNVFTAKTQELSDLHKASLESLSQGTYSKPSFQMSRAEKKTIYRILYLVNKSDYPAPTFESLSQHLRNDLTQKAIAQESQTYLNKLRKHYGYEPDKTLPEDFHPFSLQ